MDKEYFIKHIRSWDWFAYKNYYPELRKKTSHYILYHALNNKDLNRVEMFMKEHNIHVIHHESLLKNEKTFLPKDFEWKTYISMYADLSKMNEKQAKLHYILHGNEEGREHVNNILTTYKATNENKILNETNDEHIFKKIINFNNIHKNEDIYVICSGKSIDFIDDNFFDNKILIGVNRVYNRVNCNYYVRKESNNLKEYIDNFLKDDEILFISRGCSGNINNKNYELIKTNYNKKNNIIVYNHDDNVYNDIRKISIETIQAKNNKLITSYSTITSAIHLAYYMGAKNIILVGHDCCKIDNQANYSNYHNDETLSIAWKTENKDEAYINWLYSIGQMTKHIKNLLRQLNVSLLSINPFVSSKELHDSITIRS